MGSGYSYHVVLLMKKQAIHHGTAKIRFFLSFFKEGGVRVCGDAVLRYFWCGFAVIFILTRGIAVSKH